MASPTPDSYIGQPGVPLLAGRPPREVHALAGGAATAAVATGGLSHRVPLAGAAQAVAAATGNIPTVGAFSWSIIDGQTLNTSPSSPTPIAINVPAGSVYYANPDLLPGQALALSGSTLNLVSDSTVPTVNGDVAGSYLDLVSGRDTTITVVPSKWATARNVTQNGPLFGVGQPLQPGTTPGYEQHIGLVLWGEYISHPLQEGDVIEITPGICFSNEQGPLSLDGDNGYFVLSRSCTIKSAVPGARYQIFENNRNVWGDGGAWATANVFYAPRPAACGGRKDFVVQEFNINAMPPAGCAFRLKGNAPAVPGPEVPYLGVHNSITIQNFNMGPKPPVDGSVLSGDWGWSASLISGATEYATVENGTIRNGGGGYRNGEEHNSYFEASTIIMRGVRSLRNHTYWNQSSERWEGIQGHHLKLTADYAYIEGCVIENERGVPYTTNMGTSGACIQMKGGGNLVVRGTLFIGTIGNHNPFVQFEREKNGYQVENFPPWSGRFGNTVLIEKCVFYGDLVGTALYIPPPFIAPIDWGTAERNGFTAVGPGPTELLSVTVRDNIIMQDEDSYVTEVPYDLEYIFASTGGFNDTWRIAGDMTNAQTWLQRGNVVMPYSYERVGFNNPSLRDYSQTAGAIGGATGGTVATKRYVWAEWYVNRTDAFKGLG